MPISWTRFQLFEMSPFICDSIDLEYFEYNEIIKRELITPFNFSYFYAKCLNYDDEKKKILIFDKSEVKVDKTIMKFSYNDLRLIYDVFKKIRTNYMKFGKYLLKKKEEKHISESLNMNSDRIIIEEKNVDLDIPKTKPNFIKSTQKALEILTSYTIVKRGTSTYSSR